MLLQIELSTYLKSLPPPKMKLVFPPLSRNNIHHFPKLDLSLCSLWASNEFNQLSVFPFGAVVYVCIHPQCYSALAKGQLSRNQVLALYPLSETQGSDSSSDCTVTVFTTLKAHQHVFWVSLSLQIPTLPRKSQRSDRNDTTEMHATQPTVIVALDQDCKLYSQ